MIFDVADPYLRRLGSIPNFVLILIAVVIIAVAAFITIKLINRKKDK